MAGFSCSREQFAKVNIIVGNDDTAAGLVCSSFNVSALGATNAVVAWSLKQLTEVRSHVDAVDVMSTDTKQGLDASFVLTSSYIIFVMQAGFALYAAGVVRPKSKKNILMKNFIDAAIAGIVFFLVGFAFAFGQERVLDSTAPDGVRVNKGNGFIGAWEFALAKSENPSIWADFMFNWSFCAAGATIMSGAVAERITLHAYLAYSVFFCAWVYPLVVHWLWSTTGWLSPYNPNAVVFKGAIDFAGSGVVHSLAGWTSLIAAHAVGPRINRFKSNTDQSEFQKHTPHLYVLGTFLLWFGWYGFNPGSLRQISTQQSSKVVGRIAVVSTLAATSGSIVAAFLGYWLGVDPRPRDGTTRKDTEHGIALLQTKATDAAPSADTVHASKKDVKSSAKVLGRWDLQLCCSGLLAGLVAVTGGCSVLPAWAAIMVGAAAAVVYFYAARFIDWKKIDDPVQAFAMHGCCGMLGLLWIGLFADKVYVTEVYAGIPDGYKYHGALLGGGWRLLVAQLAAIATIVAWATFWASLMFYGMNWLQRYCAVRILRLSPEQEEDPDKHLH